MEVTVIGSSQTGVARSVSSCREFGLFGLRGDHVLTLKKTRICFEPRRNWKTETIGLKLKLNSVRAGVVELSQKGLRSSSTSASRSKHVQSGGVRLFVGLPLDSVSECNSVKHERAIASGLKALKLLGVEGVELPVWWGVVEKKDMGEYEWSGYLAIAEMVQKAGLKLHVSFCFHGSTQPQISLPEWVSRIGENDPSIFYTDRSGKQYKECLSLGVDDIPVLRGKTPIHVYQKFLESFKASFSGFLDSTITGITMGLGPDGELRYPSYHQSPQSNKARGVGEFQCYDQHMLNLLKQCAESTNPCWGLAGPHDAPSYDESPDTNNFFKEHGGSWETPYGDFFLSWYSSQLISHGDLLLSVASATLGDTQVAISGKLPLVHTWYETRSHPSELTAGFYNTITRNGYEPVAEIFAKNSCKMILPGMDLSDPHKHPSSFSSPELLLAQIMTACRNHGVNISGQNSSISGANAGFRQIKKNLSGESGAVDLFTYNRMGAYFFSPEHFASFTQFVRSVNQLVLHSDYLSQGREEEAQSLHKRSTSSSNLHLQTASVKSLYLYSCKYNVKYKPKSY